ncbi:MAG: hypothetical protein ACI9HA_003086, partial [Dinoroseobacter sp.]
FELKVPSPVLVILFRSLSYAQASRNMRLS